MSIKAETKAKFNNKTFSQDCHFQLAIRGSHRQKTKRRSMATQQLKNYN